MHNKMRGLFNWECSEKIVCPYCGKEYEPSYEDTYISHEPVDCYTEQEETYTCEKCGRKFTMRGERSWNYITETIDGECTEEEAEAEGWW